MATKAEPKTAVVQAGLLNVRKTASLESQVLKVVPRGTELKYTPSKKEWVSVSLEDGTVGYVLKQFLK